MSISDDPLWAPLSIDSSQDLRDRIIQQERIIDAQRTTIQCRDGTIRRLKARDATSGHSIIQYLRQLESKFDTSITRTRPPSASFDALTPDAQRWIEVLEKRLALRDDAIQLINAMLVDTIASKDAEIEALTIDLEVMKDVLGTITSKVARSECSDSISV